MYILIVSHNVIFVNLFYIRIFFYIINRIHFNNIKISKENYIINLFVKIYKPYEILKKNFN